MERNILTGILLMVLLSGVAFSTNGAALQVTGHTTVPDVIYPGTVGELQVTVLNSGTDPAATVGVDYSTPTQPTNSRINVGDIGTGSSAIVSVPFTVPQNVSSGFFIINLNIVYFGDTTDSVVKNTPVTIPVEVSQQSILETKTVSISPTSIQPGDSVHVQLDLTNTGGVMNNVVIDTPDNTSFTLQGTSQVNVGNIPYGGNVTVPFSLSSSSNTASGKYTIPLVVTYQDSLQNTVNQTISVGPVNVLSPSGQFIVSLVPLTATEVGSEAQFALTLVNQGGSDVAPIVDINQSTPFVPIGASRIYFDDIGPGMNETQVITVGIDATSSAGYYNLPLEISGNGNNFEQDVGIAVSASPDVVMTADTQPEFITAGSSGVKVVAQIANTGNTPIRSVYANADSTKDFVMVGASDKFIGTLNVDDFATFQVTMNVPQNLAPGTYSMPVTITFKDATNEAHTIVKDANITIYSPMDAARLNGISSGTTTTGTTGVRTGRPGEIFGIGYLPLGIGVVVVLVVGFFAYKRWKGGKKAAPVQPKN